MLRSLFASSKRDFSSLSEQEILALAIASEEDDARIYRAYASILKQDYAASAKIFDDMAEVEQTHRNMLIDMHIHRFGDNIPLIRREHVSGFYDRKPDWLIKNLSLEKIRLQAELMEQQAANFYDQAVARVSDADTRKLLGDLADAERGHQDIAEMLENKHLADGVDETEKETAKRQFLLTYVQPGLAGLMDGSVSTLAPIFAAAFATQDTWQTFLIGLSASQAFAEDAMGTMIMMKGGEVMAIMPDGHMGTMMPDAKMSADMMKMAKPIKHCMMMMTDAKGKTYMIDTSTKKAQAECEKMAM